MSEANLRKRTFAGAVFSCLVLIAAPDALPQERSRRVDKHPAPAPVAQKPVPEQTSEEVGADEVLRVNTALVMVPVSITDRDGRYIPDLQKEDFHIFEDGIEQRVAYFATVEKPFTVVLMLDTSASTWSKLGQIRNAALTFVEQLRPDDQVMVVSFARGFTVKCEATNDRQKIRDAIRGTGRGLSTHLYDAMDTMMRKHVDRIRGRKAVVLFTDGVDATSHDATYESTVQFAEELDALIYSIRYDTYDPAHDTGSQPIQLPTSRLPSILRRLPIPLPTIGSGGSSGSNGGGAGSSRADYDRGERYLHDLAELTGGRVYEAGRDLSNLQAAFSHIAEELRRQYSLGYYPMQHGRAGERRRIKVRVGRPDLAVRTRDSYIYKTAPNANTAAQDQIQTPNNAPVLKKRQLTSVGGGF
jgi:Ca-activated chloride channel family protein